METFAALLLPLTVTPIFIVPVLVALIVLRGHLIVTLAVIFPHVVIQEHALSVPAQPDASICKL
jgi:hypothetical protein